MIVRKVNHYQQTVGLTEITVYSIYNMIPWVDTVIESSADIVSKIWTVYRLNKHKIDRNQIIRHYQIMVNVVTID